MSQILKLLKGYLIGFKLYVTWFGYNDFIYIYIKWLANNGGLQIAC